MSKSIKEKKCAEIYLDTSSISQLFHCFDDQSIKKMIDRFDIRLSVLNIMEIGVHDDLKKRNDMLRFCAKLNKEKYHPLALPKKILENTLIAIKNEQSIISWSVDENEGRVFLALLQEPINLSKKQIIEFKRFLRKQADIFRIQNNNARKHFESFKIDYSVPELEFPNKFLEFVFSKDEILDDFFEVTIKTFSDVEKGLYKGSQILRDVEPWFLYFSAYNLGSYNLSFKKTHYSPKKNPGYIDIAQAIYLGACDIFVTDDFNLNELLTIIVNSKYVHRKIKIVNSTELRKMI